MEFMRLLWNAKNRIDYVCVMKHNGKSTVCAAGTCSAIALESEHTQKKRNQRRESYLCASSAIIWIDKCYTSTINKSLGIWGGAFRFLSFAPLFLVGPSMLNHTQKVDL